MTEQQIMEGLVAILDELQQLPDTAIAERAILRDRQQELRSLLARLLQDDLAEAKAEWRRQAAAKTPEDAGDISGTIPSPSEFGGGGGI